MDYYTRNSNSLTPQGTGYKRGGSKSNTANFVREINQEWMLGVEKDLARSMSMHSLVEIRCRDRLNSSR